MLRLCSYYMIKQSNGEVKVDVFRPLNRQELYYIEILRHQRHNTPVSLVYLEHLAEASTSVPSNRLVTERQPY